MSLFSGANPANLGQTEVPSQPNIQQVQLVPATPETKEIEPTGLDKFKTLSEPVDPKTLPEQFDPTKLFDMDPAKLRGEVDKLNFAGNASPEDLAAVVAGGEGAVAALQNIMNGVARNIFYNSTVASTRLVEQGITKSMPAVDGRVKSTLREHSVREALSGSDPIFNTPAAQVMLQPLQKGFMEKYPTASPTEIASMAQEYLKDFANKINPPAQTDEQKQLAAEPDWGSYLKN